MDGKRRSNREKGVKGQQRVGNWDNRGARG